jgi:HEXXH motif-containing protein
VSALEVASVHDVMVASGRFRATLTTRAAEAFETHAPRSTCRGLAMAAARLASESPESPWLWHWCRATYRLLPYFRGDIDSPIPTDLGRSDLIGDDDERLADLHRFAAVEALIDASVSSAWSGSNECRFDFESSALPPRSLNLGRFASVTFGDQGRAGIAINVEGGHLRLQGPEAKVDVDLLEGHVTQKGYVLVRASPAADMGGKRIPVPIHDAALTVPTMQAFPILVSDSDGRSFAARISRAYSWLRERTGNRRADDCATLCSAALPLRCGRDGIFGSGSNHEILGLLFLPQTPRVELLAESILHECLHQFLFRIDVCAPLFSEADRAERYYSPWRSDARPLDMVLHGAFVFSEVAALYQQCWRAPCPEVELADASERAYRRARQAETACATVRRYAKLSRIGEIVVQDIERRVTSILADLGLDPAVKSDIDGGLDVHAAEHSAFLR